MMIFSLLNHHLSSQITRTDLFYIKSELENMYHLDQDNRQQILNEMQLQDQKAIDELWTIQRTRDSLNQKRVKDILGIYGWLGINQIGEKANKVLFLVIQHADPETQMKYLPMMRVSALKKESSLSDYAFLVDKAMVSTMKLQLYGTQFSYDPATKKKTLYPLIQPLNIDARRKEMGLKDLKTYCKENGIELPKEN